MGAVIKSVLRGTAASKTIIAPGDTLIKINGRTISDILDYMYLSYETRLLLELTGADGKLKLVKISKSAGEDIGLEFDSYLLDKQRACANRCVFCFVDQLPGGMRDTLYYKDDDIRLSFLQGNYVTLTNLSENEIDRIVKMRVSPLNVSVHTLDPALRSFMLGNKNGALGISAMKRFAAAGITMNCQIVCCPGINDGIELGSTMRGLAGLYPYVASVSVVPVGLTRYRQGLLCLRPFDRELASKTVMQVEKVGKACLRKYGTRLFFCADELYIKAGLKLPGHKFYEEYAQIENGVGLLRLFITEFKAEMDITPVSGRVYEPFSIVTGAAAEKFLKKLLKMTEEKYGKIPGMVYAIRNEFFGESIDVAGLVTGRDILRQLEGRGLGKRLLIPENMLKHGEDVFLDGVTVGELSEKLGAEVCVIGRNGAELFRELLRVSRRG